MSSVQADGTNIPVYVLDKHGGINHNCDSQQCDEWNPDGRRSFWRRRNMPGNLVPIGWSAHSLGFGEFFYKCPICYKKDLATGLPQPEYIQIHNPGEVESNFIEGGIPDKPDKKGGRRQKKRTRKRRKSKRKKWQKRNSKRR